MLLNKSQPVPFHIQVQSPPQISTGGFEEVDESLELDLELGDELDDGKLLDDCELELGDELDDGELDGELDDGLDDDSELDDGDELDDGLDDDSELDDGDELDDGLDDDLELGLELDSLELELGLELDSLELELGLLLLDLLELELLKLDDELGQQH